MKNILALSILLAISFNSIAKGEYTNEKPKPVKYGVPITFDNDVNLTSEQYKAIGICVKDFYNKLEKDLNQGSLSTDIWSASIHAAYEDGGKFKVRTSHGSTSYVSTASYDEKYQKKGAYVKTITYESEKLWLACTL